MLVTQVLYPGNLSVPSKLGQCVTLLPKRGQHILSLVSKRCQLTYAGGKGVCGLRRYQGWSHLSLSTCGRLGAVHPPLSGSASLPVNENMNSTPPPGGLVRGHEMPGPLSER